MNREILFKAKRIDWRDLSKEQWWVEGDVQHTTSKNIILIVVDDYKAYPCDSSTLCQYTGSTDKHNNKIWENDICEMVYDGKIHIYVVVWDKTELDFKGTNGKENYGNNFEYLGCCEEIVVIGNIFDNPELLEVEQ